MGFATRLYKLSLTSEDSFIHRVYQYILPVYLYLSEAATRMEVPGKDIRIRCRTNQVSKPVSGYVPRSTDSRLYVGLILCTALLFMPAPTAKSKSAGTRRIIIEDCTFDLASPACMFI